MSPEALQAKLRRVLNTSSIEVKQDRAWAVRNKHHPLSLQVWDRGVVTGQPYIVAVCERRGVPAEPDERFFAKLWRMHADQIHRGRKGWADKIMFDARDSDEFQERRASERFRERVMSRKGEVLSMFGKGKFWSLNRSVIPK